MEITFKHFSPRTNPEFFHPYLELMYKVFISEQGWKIESNHRRKKVEVTLEDINSIFVVALDADQKVIAGVKGTLPSFYFPNSDLYGHHLGFQGLERCRDAISVVKGLVVVDRFRHRKFLINGKEKSLGHALLEELMLVLSNHGTKIIFGSPTVYQAGIQMLHCGFRIIDDAVPFDGPSRIAVHLAWSEDRESQKYFRSREKVLLKSSDGRDFLIETLKSSEKIQKKARASAG